ncbi:MAG: YhdT family protein [Atribacterota bacterium]|nr:YhdT family protein [Atribacterota bacterium]
MSNQDNSIDKNVTDYKFSDIKIDPRFKIAKREMLISFAIQILFTIIMVGIAHIFGGRPLKEYTFILGMPSWFFLLLVAYLFCIVTVSYIVLYKFKNIDINDKLRL